MSCSNTGLELGDQDAGAAVLVQFDRLRVERHAFPGADAGVGIDHHVYEHDEALLGPVNRGRPVAGESSGHFGKLAPVLPLPKI